MSPDKLSDSSWVATPIGRVAAPLREQVIAVVRQAIRDFDLKPGQRLVERELMEKLQVSRTTVREAIRELASEGLITVIPQRGAVIAAPSLEEASDLYEVRAALEPLIVRRFLERATDQEVAQLTHAVDQVAEIVGTVTDVRVILHAKDQFYRVLIAGARSATLQQILEVLHARIQMLRATSLSRAGRPLQMLEELRAIVRAIADRDVDLAATLTAAHVRRAAAAALSNLRETNND